MDNYNLGRHPLKKHTLLVILSFIFLGFISQTTEQEKEITFSVIPKSLPDAAVIYITGNHKKLGMWNPGAVPLERQHDACWSKTFWFKNDANLEYKITRGSWQTEAVNLEGAVLPNSRLSVKNDTTIIIKIENWKDISHKIEGQITGVVKYHRNIKGEGIKQRDIIVWLPTSYETSLKKQYPVLYMHDGQNIFDPITSYINVDWQIDETADSLISNGKMEEIIIVGIYNTVDREEEYSNSPQGQLYMRFLVNIVKPFIDETYRTLPGVNSTATMGSSMGGLISFLLVWNYPKVFSQAGCLSPAFIYNKNNSVKLVEQYRGSTKPIRIYIDNGGVGLEDILQPGCERMLRALQRKGFKIGENLEWFYDEHAEHSERAWAKRVWRPLIFMYSKKLF